MTDILTINTKKLHNYLVIRKIVCIFAPENKGRIMTREEVEEKLGENKLVYGSVPVGLLVGLSKLVNVNLEMDSQTKDYFYRISVDELTRSGAPADLLDELRDGGWALDSSKENIELYLKA